MLIALGMGCVIMSDFVTYLLFLLFIGVTGMYFIYAINKDVTKSVTSVLLNVKEKLNTVNKTSVIKDTRNG